MSHVNAWGKPIKEIEDRDIYWVPSEERKGLDDPDANALQSRLTPTQSMETSVVQSDLSPLPVNVRNPLAKLSRGRSPSMRYTLKRFSFTRLMGIYSCRKVGDTSTMSIHACGRALDVGIPTRSDGKANTELSHQIVQFYDRCSLELAAFDQIYDRVRYDAGCLVVLMRTKSQQHSRHEQRRNQNGLPAASVGQEEPEYREANKARDPLPGQRSDGKCPERQSKRGPPPGLDMPSRHRRCVNARVTSPQ